MLLAPGACPLNLSRKLILIISLASIGSVGTVAGLVYSPGSPGFPYLSPTYQAQKATFQVGQGSAAALYEVYYVPWNGQAGTLSSQGATPLIVVLAATYPQTHFYKVYTYGGSSPQGNFSVPAVVNNEKTWLVIPASSCPAPDQIPSSGYTMNIQITSDSPLGYTSFSYTCIKMPSPQAVTLGNPHIVVPSLVGPPPTPPNVGKEAMILESSGFNSGTNVTMNLRNTGTVAITLNSYYVKNATGGQWSRLNWQTAGYNVPAAIAPNAVGTLYVTIGGGTGGGTGGTCGASYCTQTGSGFTTFTSGYQYTIVVVTSRNNQFSFTVTR